MKTLIVFFLALIFSNCDKNQQTVIDTFVDISIVDSGENDLLDPQHPNALTENTIDTYYMINGSLEKFYNSDYTYPKGFMIFNDENKYRLRIFPNDYSSKNLQTIYIKYNNSDMDIVKCEIYVGENIQRCTKVWYNDELKWDNASKTERHFEIIK